MLKIIFVGVFCIGFRGSKPINEKYFPSIVPPELFCSKCAKEFGITKDMHNSTENKTNNQIHFILPSSKCILSVN
jgi:hypothetical protein